MEKTISQCAADGCPYCSYILGYLYFDKIGDCFRSGLLGALHIATAYYVCDQQDEVMKQLAKRARIALS